MTYEAEQFHVTASIEGLGVVWEETLAARDLGIVADLRSADPGRNVIAENGYDVSLLTIVIRAVPLSDFDKLCQDAKREAAEEAALIAAEDAERAQRRAAGITQAEAELKAAGVEFELRSDSSWATVYDREGRPLGTIQMPNRILRERNWTYHTTDGALAFTAPGRLTVLRRLVKLYA